MAVRACAVEGCPKPAGLPGTAKNKCSMHYWRGRRNGSPLIRMTRVLATDQPCTVEGCGRKAAGRGLCGTHWQQWKRTGDPLTQTRSPLWTAAEDQRLLDILNDTPGGVCRARPGELQDVGLILARSDSACRSRLYKLRQRRRAAYGASCAG